MKVVSNWRAHNISLLSRLIIYLAYWTIWWHSIVYSQQFVKNNSHVNLVKPEVMWIFYFCKLCMCASAVIIGVLFRNKEWSYCFVSLPKSGMIFEICWFIVFICRRKEWFSFLYVFCRISLLVLSTIHNNLCTMIISTVVFKIHSSNCSGFHVCWSWFGWLMTLTTRSLPS